MENNMRKRKEYSSETKEAAVKRAMEIGNITTASKEYNLPQGTLNKWIAAYKESGIEAFTNKSRRPKNQPKKTSSWIIDKIIKIKKEKPEIGSKALSEHLNRFESINLSSRTVGKIFKKHDLPDGDAGYHENSFYTKGDPGKKLEKTIEMELGQWERFSRPNPNDLWQMDIKDFYIRDCHRVYLISALDDCSRFIVSFGLFRDQTSENVLEVLRSGLAKYGAPGEILTDQGAQFKHWNGITKFEKLLKKLNIKHIKARSHHPQTCGKIEAFHKTLNRELIDKEFFISQEAATEKISRYIEHYNYGRPHSAHEGYTPSDKYFGVIESVKKYLQDFKVPKNKQEESDETISIARSSKLYLIGKILDQDIRIQEAGGQFSVYVNNNLFKEINLIHSVTK
jgi:transposase InsO family protein/transposase-like protein